MQADEVIDGRNIMNRNIQTLGRLDEKASAITIAAAKMAINSRLQRQGLELLRDPELTVQANALIQTRKQIDCHDDTGVQLIEEIYGKLNGIVKRGMGSIIKGGHINREDFNELIGDTDLYNDYWYKCFKNYIDARKPTLTKYAEQGIRNINANIPYQKYKTIESINEFLNIQDNSYIYVSRINAIQDALHMYKEIQIKSRQGGKLTKRSRRRKLFTRRKKYI